MNPEPVVAISAIEHWAYCPRQCALIHVDGIWADNEHTVRGTRGHRRADTPGGRQERGQLVLRAVPLWSERLGLSGRGDAIHVGPDGSLAPVEYKTGGRHGDAAHLQVCAQALCLEEMTGSVVPVAYLWFSGPKQRVPVALDAALRQRTEDVIHAIRRAMAGSLLPPPVNDERCGECQLLGHCLPNLVAHPVALSTYLEREVFGCAS